MYSTKTFIKNLSLYELPIFFQSLMGSEKWRCDIPSGTTQLYLHPNWCMVCLVLVTNVVTCTLKANGNLYESFTISIWKKMYAFMKSWFRWG